MRFDGVQLTGYTSGGGHTYDAYTECYGVQWQGSFCVGPGTKLSSVASKNIQLGNNQKSPVYNASISLAGTYNNFQIRSREEGPQNEGVVWNKGAFLLR